MEKGWYCFYLPEGSNNAPFQHLQGSNSAPMQNNAPPIPSFDAAVHQSELTALSLANQNEDLQKELANVRQDQVTAQKEALELKNQLAEMRKQIDSLKAEKTRINQPPQPQPIQQPSPMSQQSNMTIGHERSRSSQQHHHLPSAPHQPSYAPQYQPNAQHMYHQPAPSQATHSRTHGQPVYQTNDNRAQPANAWNQGLYGAYQQSQHSGGMLPSTHMMGGYR